METESKKVRLKAYVQIGKGENGGTYIKVNGTDISSMVTHFSVSQSGGDYLPTVHLDIPARLELDFHAMLDIDFK